MNSFFQTLVAFLLLTSLYAEDSNQYLLGQEGIPEMDVSSKTNSYFLIDKTDEQSDLSKPTAEKSHMLIEEAKESDHNKIPKLNENSGILPSGAYDGRDEYLEQKNKDIVVEIDKMGRHELSLSYLLDDYDYTSNKDVFNRTYSGSGSKRSGYFFLGYANFLTKKRTVFPAWGIKAGFSYNSGQGIFEDSGTRSIDADIKLWTVPIDLEFILNFSFFSWLDIAISGGPSVMGLFQSRSDFEEDEPYKRRRQVGYGYFGSSRFKLNLGRLFLAKSVDLYSEYSLTRFFTFIEIRYHSYDHFQEEGFSISGSSIGGGFSFEFK